MNVFLRVNVTFYDAVNMNYDVIRTDRPCPCTAKFMFVVVRNNKTQQIRGFDRSIECVHSCRTSNICNEVGRIDNFQALARKI